MLFFRERLKTDAAAVDVITGGAEGATTGAAADAATGGREGSVCGGVLAKFIKNPSCYLSAQH